MNNDQVPDQDFNYQRSGQDMSVGELLRRTRMHYNLSIGEVEKALRIRAVQLSALEDGRADLLPGRVYAIGFVRAYAEYLGLDGDKVVALFKRQSDGTVPRPELTMPVSASESKTPGLPVLGLSVFALAVVVAGFVFLSSGGKGGDGETIPPVPVAEDVSEALADAASSTALTASPPLEDAVAAVVADVAEKPSSRVVINILDSAWIEIRKEGGKSLVSRILKKGDSYMVPDEDGLVLDTGNAGALEFVVDGETLPVLGEKGDVTRGFSLDPEKLKKVAADMPDSSETR